MQRIVGFDKIVHGNDKILILGSMPSVKSLQENFYYANKTNRFWPMLGEIYHYPFETKGQKLMLLENAHIALWDICHSCIRKNSADATIREIEPNNILGLLHEEPSIQKILCNGKTSYHAVKKYIPSIANQVLICPSTSSANARYRLDDLIVEYRKSLGVYE